MSVDEILDLAAAEFFYLTHNDLLVNPPWGGVVLPYHYHSGREYRESCVLI